MAGYYINGTKYTTGLQLIAKSGALNDDFIQGNTHVVSFILDSKFSSTLTSLRCFPNLETFIIMKTDGVVNLNSNIFDGTLVLVSGKIIVPNSLLNDYKTAYPLWEAAFDSWQFQIEFTIPYIGNTELTAEYVQQVVAIAGGQASVVTKVIVPNDFTDYEAGALGYLFDVFDNMTDIESPWLSGSLTGWLDCIISGSGTMTAEVVNSNFAKLGYALSAKVNCINIPQQITGGQANCLDNVMANYITAQDVLIKAYGNPFSDNASSIYSGMYTAGSRIQKVILTGERIVGWRTFYATQPIAYFVNANYFEGDEAYRSAGGKTYLLSTTEKNLRGARFAESSTTKFFVNHTSSILGYWHRISKLYVSANEMLLYPNANEATTKVSLSNTIGVLDGASIYKNMEGYSYLSCDYPTLSATLTIDSSGHLIENGTDLFTGYTATWYSDEDCTTVISDPTTITASDTVYVKLTAI